MLELDNTTVDEPQHGFEAIEAKFFDVLKPKFLSVEANCVI